MGSSGGPLKGPSFAFACGSCLLRKLPTFKLQVAQDLKVGSSARQQGALFLLFHVLCELGTILIKVREKRPCL